MRGAWQAPTLLISLIWTHSPKNVSHFAPSMSTTETSANETPTRTGNASIMFAS
jgi:hypothetical protein